MTQSQLLNDKHEVIVPEQSISTAVKSKKYIILTILVAIILSTIAYFSLKVDKNSPKKIKKAEEKKAKVGKEPTKAAPK